jgi:hypothetical protein
MTIDEKIGEGIDAAVDGALPPAFMVKDLADRAAARVKKAARKVGELLEAAGHKIQEKVGDAAQKILDEWPPVSSIRLPLVPRDTKGT